MDYQDLREWGKEAGYPTQVALARLLETTQPTIARWRRGGIPRYRQFEISLRSGGQLQVDRRFLTKIS